MQTLTLAALLASVLAASVLGTAPAAQASVLTYVTTLSGANESPANASPGTGTGQVTVDTVANTLRVVISFSNLLGNTVAGHIHCCTAVAGTGNAAVATEPPAFPGFPLGVTAGSSDSTLDLTAAASYNPPFLASNGGSTAVAEAALLAGLAGGNTYLNIHSSQFPGGEVRGYLQVPEPASLALLGLGVGGLLLARRRATA